MYIHKYVYNLLDLLAAQHLLKNLCVTVAAFHHNFRTQIQANVNIPPHPTQPPHPSRSINFMKQVQVNVTMQTYPTPPHPSRSINFMKQAQVNVTTRTFICMYSMYLCMCVCVYLCMYVCKYTGMFVS